MAKDNEIYLSTGIDHLDDLLSADRDRNIYEEGGIFIGKGIFRSDIEPPIVVIEGTTGTGKTSLALQIAHQTARNSNWLVFFYSLEQTVRALINVSNNFGGYERDQDKENVSFCDLSDPKELINFEPSVSKINFCEFSPRPLNIEKTIDIFQQRIDELEHVLSEVAQKTDKHVFTLFIIDAITALSSKPLHRNQIYKFLSLFRHYHIPAVLTLERFSTTAMDNDEITYDTSKFLADIVISLSKEVYHGYLHYYLEIVKSRVCRQALGKHLYKIRTLQNVKDIQTDPRKGIVVYPSIHYVLSTVRARGEQKGHSPKDFIIDDRKDHDLGLILNAQQIAQNSSIAIVGTNGTHKLALALNFAMGAISRKQTKLLIINFGRSGHLVFKGVAWTKYNAKWRNLKPIQKTVFERQTKFWHTDYSIENEENLSSEPNVTITSFKIGQLTPEECFDVIEDKLHKADKEEKPYTSVLLNNTAELCTGFPLLKAEPLFIPTLIDLFAVHQLVAVSIGVEDIKSSSTTDVNFAVLANADYRILLSHYPSIYEFSKEIINSKRKNDQKDQEQFVSLVIDNVTGKHYVRQPRWLWVEELEVEKTIGKSKKDIQKTLHCDRFPNIKK